ncbi:uroporphyrinogen-III synthase [Tengunoibacter tsumagoiensis]|uniref:Tetrapyrrole biosynthesis uroporphyrinogen III synthase domain-containing protein n=1 Tax=Tengunoibacter tsumagoiensis TaxID=2014871 RepID=A0A402A1S9_9CHLR|nr:uroporphyrinogen-III synthase [Tengunoibacter tsumagoiensis]GCE13107.1 hypothetical protein KTT_29660 [Tengunoibacter tsumagoiensis]
MSDSLPLQGKRILVTRTREQASVLCEQLRASGAIPVEFPTIRIVPPDDWSALDQALSRLFIVNEVSYDWLVLTSANGVAICMERLLSLGYQPQQMRAVWQGRIATIGPATAAALEHYGLQADLIPSEYVAEGVIQALLQAAERDGRSIAGQRILLARAAEARKILFTELQQAGANVEEVAAYYTFPVTRDDEQGRTVFQQLQNRQIDLLTFTSSSTVRNFVSWLQSYGPDGQRSQIAEQIKIASIGPITSQTARELGLRVDIEAQEFTIDGLVKAIIQSEEKVSW